MFRRLLVFFCKILIKLLRMLGKNGSALPGLIIERLYPRFLSKSLKSVEGHIVLVTGTNGKTTTTKMLVEALRGVGLTVVTNTTGSNMTRGLIAALIEDMTYYGSLKPTDWFVFEMDEAYTPIFTSELSPYLVVGLNVLRDQLDRYGEIDKTAALITTAASRAQNYIYNELDPLLADGTSVLADQGVNLSSFGVDRKLIALVENEQTVHGSEVVVDSRPAQVAVVAVEQKGDGQLVTVDSYDKQIEMHIPVKGFHNVLNATAVVAALEVLEPDVAVRAAESISQMPVPFGRGERLHIRNKDITVALVKNPSGFASNLETFVHKAKPEAILFVVNDKLADGRDVSWLWDVEFASKVPKDTVLYVAGIRGYDMAIRLKHDGLESHVTLSSAKAIQLLMQSKHKNIVIIPTYTSLFEVRTALSKYGKVPRIW